MFKINSYLDLTLTVKMETSDLSSPPEIPVDILLGSEKAGMHEFLQEHSQAQEMIIDIIFKPNS